MDLREDEDIAKILHPEKENKDDEVETPKPPVSQGLTVPPLIFIPGTTVEYNDDEFWDMK